MLSCRRAEIPPIVGGWKFDPLDNQEKFLDAGSEWHTRHDLCFAHPDSEACGYGYRDTVRGFMKIQHNTHHHNLSIAREYENYQLVRGNLSNLPEIIDYGKDGPWTYLVVEDLGMDLGKFYRTCRFLKFSLVARLVSEMVCFLASSYVSL